MSDEHVLLRIMVVERGLRAATDDQLRAELERRGEVPSIVNAVKHATDDVLRAECERRWPPGATDSKYVALERERDEALHRAETAEKALFQMQGAAKALAARVDGPPQFDDGATDEQMRECEAGPGIKALSERRSEPLAFLDEDLLADDAP